MPGFLKPTTTPTPDELFDVWLSKLSGSELKVLLYIIRRTFGFGKHVDAISLSQITKGIQKKNGEVLDLGTGLSRKSAYQAVQSLEEKGLIKVGRALADDGINEINTYSLFFREGVGEKLPYGRGKSTLGVGTKFPSQETVEQETVKQETDSNLPPSAPSTSTQNVPESTVLEITIKTCSQQFADLEHLDSNIAQVYNLWRSTDLDEDGMLAKVQEARQITLRRISSSQVKDCTKKMAYFFRVLEDVLGLKQAKS